MTGLSWDDGLELDDHEADFVMNGGFGNHDAFGGDDGFG